MLKGKIEIEALLEAELIGDFEPGSVEWLTQRSENGAIGGSDIGAIAGLSPWESAITKWAKKTGKIADEITPSMAMRLGTKLEAPILEIFSEEHPELEIFTTGTWQNKKLTWMRANPDGLYKTPEGNWGILEIKFSRDYWSEVPQHYRAQVLWYMKTFGIKEAKLVALAGSSYQEFEIEWDEFEAESLIKAAEKFRAYAELDKMPDWDGSSSTFETIRAINPNIEDGEVDLDDLGMHYFNKLQDADKITKELTELKSRVLSAMEGKKRGIIFGDHLISLRSRSGGLPYLHHEKTK